jgi:stage II sporulation protein M
MAGTRLLGLKRVFFDSIFVRSYWTWRKHPLIIVPSMLGTALNVIEQSIITLGLIVLLTSLAMRGLLSGFLSQLSQSGAGLSLLQNASYAPVLIPIVVLSAIGVVFTAILGAGFVYSSEYGIYLDAWNSDKVSMASIIEDGSRRWKAMAWTFLLSNLITWGPLLVGFALFLVAAVNASTVAGFVVLAASSAVIYLGLGISLFLSLFTVYSYPAVVVDKVSGLQAVRKSFGIVGRNLGVTLSYSLVRVLFQLLLTLVVLLTGNVGLPLSSLSAAILSFLLTPVLHSTKTMIYYYARPGVPEMSFELSSPIWYDITKQLPRAVWLKIRAGLAEAARFAASPRNLPFHLLSLLAFAIGILLGDYVSVNGVKGYLVSTGYVPGQGNPLLNQVFGPSLGADIFLNNWLVSIATGLAGLGFGAPSFLTIMFNGFILGVLVPLSTLTMLLAAILPHGSIEIPSFILAGSMGIKLGYAAFIRVLGGRKNETSLVGTSVSGSDDYLSRTLRQTVYMVVGLAPLFLIAGLIEADITPIIMRMFGWTF